MKFLSNLLFVSVLVLHGSLAASANNDGTVIHFVEGRPVLEFLPELRGRGQGSGSVADQGKHPFPRQLYTDINIVPVSKAKKEIAAAGGKDFCKSYLAQKSSWTTTVVYTTIPNYAKPTTK